MKAKIEFKIENELELPINYNHILQAVILNWLNDKSYQEFVHDKGYEYQNSKFKLYTFSRIFGPYLMDSNNNKIKFRDKIHIYIGTKDDNFLRFLGSNLLLNDNLKLGNTKVYLSSFQIIEEAQSGECMVETVSPITIYSTFINGENSKKTYYYSPFETEYSTLIKRNLIKKYVAYYGKEPENDEFSIKPIGNCRMSTIRYQGFIIKGYNGKFKLTGSKELIDMGLSSGLGGKNSMGLGCVIKV